MCAAKSRAYHIEFDDDGVTKQNLNTPWPVKCDEIIASLDEYHRPEEWTVYTTTRSPSPTLSILDMSPSDYKQGDSKSDKSNLNSHWPVPWKEAPGRKSPTLTNREYVPIAVEYRENLYFRESREPRRRHFEQYSYPSADAINLQSEWAVAHNRKSPTQNRGVPAPPYVEYKGNVYYAKTDDDMTPCETPKNQKEDDVKVETETAKPETNKVADKDIERDSSKSDSGVEAETAKQEDTKVSNGAKKPATTKNRRAARRYRQ